MDTSPSLRDWLCEAVNKLQAVVTDPTKQPTVIDEVLRTVGGSDEDAKHLLARLVIADFIVSSLTAGGTVSPLVLQACCRLRDGIWHSQSADSIPHKERGPARFSDNRIVLAERVRTLLERHYAEHLPAKRVAELMHARQSALSSSFQDTFGTTIHRYLTCVRVRRGLDLVRSGMKIEAVALAVGFRSKKDFYRAVYRAVGCTPAEFRARSADDQQLPKSELP